MTAPRKKRKPGRPGRPPGSKDKVKRVRRPRTPKPEPISEDPSPDEYAQHVGALQDVPLEMSFVAGYFGLDKIEGEPISQPLLESRLGISEANRDLCRQDDLPPYKPEELASHQPAEATLSEFVVPSSEVTRDVASQITTKISSGLSLQSPQIIPPSDAMAADKIFEGAELACFREGLATEELKSVLCQIDAKVKDLASYPMDHGLRCGMNEVERLLVANREKFSK